MAAGGLGIAMLLILVALQVSHDFNELLYGERNRSERADFLVINKKITNEMMGDRNKSIFSQQEIADLVKQPFVEGHGIITSSQFRVTGQALGFSTELFFEAVPDTFIDVKNDEWKWQQGQQVIPLILPSDFLDLFNFGFAIGNSMPQISEESIKALDMNITISQGLRQGQFTAKIAGFSDRISSILVPMSFMQWANGIYGTGTGAGQQPSRMIIKTNDPSDPALVKYLEEHGYSTNNEKLRFSKQRLVVQTVTSVVGFFGLVLLMFALLVFSMFIQLVVASCRKEIRLLITLGVAPGQLQRYLLKQFIPLYIGIGLISLLIVAALQWWVSALLAQHKMYVSAWPGIATLIAAAAIMLLVYLVNLLAVKKHIRSVGY